MLAVKFFCQVIPHCHVLLSTDNTTVAAYLNKEGGGAVTNPVIHGDQSARLVHEATCLFNGKGCTWEAERSGRLPLQERADSSHGVDHSQGHPVSEFSILRDPPLRSVCHEAEQSTSGFCFSIPRSTSISPNPTPNEGARENGERNMFGHPDSSMLVKSPILSDASFPVGCSSNQYFNSGGSFEPTSLPSFSSEAGILQPTRLALLQEGLEKAGFSKESAKSVCAVKRSSTQSLYYSRWNTWMDWCLEREIDPIDPCVKTMAVPLSSFSRKRSFYLLLLRDICQLLLPH